MYTSSENYPEEKPAQDSSLALVAEYIGIAGLVAGDFDPAAAIGNCIEAETVGGKTQAAATLTQQLYQQVYKNTTRKAEIFARNIQALNVLGGVFFADLNRVWAQAEEFINRPPMEQMIESAAEASWRRRLEGYVLSDRIAISGISEGIKLCITPKIYTKLPVDDESGQAGYVSATRGEYTIDAPNSGQNIGLDGVMGFNAPILVKTVSNAEVSAVEASMSSSEASQEHRKTALDQLKKLYRSLSGASLQTIDFADVAALVPGATNVGMIQSIDMYVDFGSPSFLSPYGPPSDYWMELMCDGQVIGQRLVQVHSSRKIGKKDNNPFLHLPPAPEDLPKQTAQPFGREHEDMNLSVIAVPVQILSSASDRKFRRNLPARAHKEYLSDSRLLQINSNRNCAVAHFAVTASY